MLRMLFTYWVLGYFSVALFPSAFLNDFFGCVCVLLEYILDVLWLIFAFGVLWPIGSKLTSFCGAALVRSPLGFFASWSVTEALSGAVAGPEAFKLPENR